MTDPDDDLYDKVPLTRRWVCRKCGRKTEPGAPLSDLRDSSCIIWAVLCHAERGANGAWRAWVDDEAPDGAA